MRFSTLTLFLAFPLLVLAVACGDDSGVADSGPPPDASVDAGTPDGGGEGDAGVPQLPVDPAFEESYAPVGDAVVTTLRETYAPRYGWAERYVMSGRSRVPLDEFGTLHPQPGEAWMLRDQLALAGGPSTLTPGALPAAARSAHFGFLISDPQFVDQESPVVVPNNNNIGAAAYRPHGDFAPALGDALLRSMNEFHDMRPVEAVYITGDLVENAQKNELQWLLTVMNGGEMSIDSGARDDVVPGPDNDAADPFVAEGLRPGVPWYTIIGNHCILANGNFPPGFLREVNETPAAVAALTPVLMSLGLSLPGISDSGMHPGYFAPARRAAFTVDMNAFELSQLPYTTDAFAGLVPTPIPADPMRAHHNPCEYMQAHLDAGGVPVGHGFTPEMVASCEAFRSVVPNRAPGGWYTADVVPGVLRLIALALGPMEGGDSGVLGRPPTGCMVAGDPCRDDPRYDQVAFLQQELARAVSDHVAVMVMSHQASSDMVVTPHVDMYRSLFAVDPVVQEIADRWIITPEEAVSDVEFRQMLAESGNVIAHFAGHNHRHQVRAVCPDGTILGAGDGRCTPGPDGQTGYWEVTTSAIVDFPHQGRFFEVVHVGDNVGAFYLTVLDPRIPDGSLAELGRFISRADIAARIGGVGGLGEITDRNLLLPFELPDDVAAAWTAATMEDDLASETILDEEAAALPSLPVWP